MVTHFSVSHQNVLYANTVLQHFCLEFIQFANEHKLSFTFCFIL